MGKRAQVIKELEDQLAKTDLKAEQYEAKAAAAMKTVNQLKAGIDKIFNKLGCTASTSTDMIGNQGVSESNMQQYLGLIEQRTNEVLQLYATAQMAQLGGKSDVPFAFNSMLGNGPALPAGSVNISIQPPTTAEDSDEESADSDDLDRPLSREELRQRTLRGLMRKDEYTKLAKGGARAQKGKGAKHKATTPGKKSDEKSAPRA
jgi:hypothetical protein